jgi:hypothetical protein
VNLANADRIERFAASERWLADERRVAHPAGGLIERVVDVTRATAWLDARTRAGSRWATGVLVVRAAALALARRPDLHTTVAGYRTLVPGAVDIGFAASGLARDTPLLLPSADGLSLAALAAAVEEGARAAGSDPRADLGRWAWLIPFAFLRRAFLRWMGRSLRLRRRLCGTFLVTCASGVDLVAPLRFHTGSALGAGRVREVIAARDGRIVTRSVMSLTLVADHVTMDGVRAAALLNEIAGLLEGDELALEML